MNAVEVARELLYECTHAAQRTGHSHAEDWTSAVLPLEGLHDMDYDTPFAKETLCAYRCCVVAKEGAHDQDTGI